MISIDSQVPGDFSTNGLFMSGEYPTAVQLSAANVVNVPVTVERLTAKIRLGSLTVTPDANLSLGDFVITGVSAQMVRDKARALGTLASSGFGYVSGVVPSGDQSGAVVKSFLNSPYTLPGGYTAGTTLNPEAYFYVFPNDDADNKVTMLNIYGTYLGEPMYFPFVINAEASTEGGNTTDGTWIQRNMVYTLNVHLKKIGSGSDNPNIPNEEVSMEVTVSVEDWAGELIQNVEW